MTLFSAVRYIVLIFLIALLSCVYPASASARLSGEVALNYTDYSVSDNQNNHVSSNLLTQEYSLLYSSSGSVYNSRLGRYSLSLGYNWSALDGHTSSNTGAIDFNSSRGHFLYSGDLQLDPKELPIRFNAYSRDLTRNTYVTTNTTVVDSVFSKNNGYLIGKPELATGIKNGIHIESGATLVAGVKNGMTNGYNEVLRHFPMILVDYKDQLNRDMHSDSPVDNRLSRLAFVSLNKKDNWFHYRYTTYKDNINASNNYSERQFQLGTVDQSLARRWIDFSNWLQVSADLQLTKRINNNQATNYNETDLNLFVQARRSNWEARNYNNFNRYREDNGRLTYKTTLPLNVNGMLSPDLSWSTRALYEDIRDNNNSRLEKMLAGYRVEGFRRALFKLVQSFDVESSKSEHSDLFVVSGGVEATSSSRFSQKLYLGASYTIKNSVQNNSGADSNFLEQRLALSSAYAVNNQLRISLTQNNDFTIGQWQTFLSTVRDANNSSMPVQYYSPRSGSMDAFGSSSYRSVTTMSIAWNPLPRFNVGLVVSEDIFRSEKSNSSNITNISATVGYEGAAFKFNNMLTYYDGSFQMDSNSSTLSNVTTLQYSFNRNLDAKFMLAYNKYVASSTETNSINLEQRLDYTHYSKTGFLRKVFEINEMLAYSNSPEQAASLNSTPGTINSISSANTFSSSYYNTSGSTRNVSRGSLSLGFKYYPIKVLVLSAGGRYQYDVNVNNYSLMWYSSATTNFRLFQASLDYYQGKRQSDGLVEKKFTANVKKLF